MMRPGKLKRVALTSASLRYKNRMNSKALRQMLLNNNGFRAHAKLNLKNVKNQAHTENGSEVSCPLKNNRQTYPFFVLIRDSDSNEVVKPVPLPFYHV